MGPWMVKRGGSKVPYTVIRKTRMSCRRSRKLSTSEGKDRRDEKNRI